MCRFANPRIINIDLRNLEMLSSHAPARRKGGREKRIGGGAETSVKLKQHRQVSWLETNPVTKPVACTFVRDIRQRPVESAEQFLETRTEGECAEKENVITSLRVFVRSRNFRSSSPPPPPPSVRSPSSRELSPNLFSNEICFFPTNESRASRRSCGRKIGELARSAATFAARENT